MKGHKITLIIYSIKNIPTKIYKKTKERWKKMKKRDERRSG